MNKSLILVLVSVLVLSLVYAGFSWQQAMAEPESAPETGISQSENIQIVQIEAGSFYFNPNEIRVKKGEKVRVTLNSVSMMHNFVVDELGIESPVVKNGETATFEFVADQAGTFTFYCSIPQHRQNGQVGTLIVEE